MDADLTRERGLWGPPSGSKLDKWALDMVEGNGDILTSLSVSLAVYLYLAVSSASAQLSVCLYPCVCVSPFFS